jgi:serine/threonine-protein kinase PknG
MSGERCTESGCTGTIAADGYCDTCGAKAKAVAHPARGHPLVAATSVSSTFQSGSTRSRGSRRTSTRSTSRRASVIGAGIVDVPPALPLDPTAAVLRDAVVAEDKRFCSSCGAPVGRARPDAPQGRTSGVCSQCRHRFDFDAKLRPDDVVGRQYEVVGPIAHGGLGWIYLARDHAVNDRWVVLKGLLDAGDEAATRVALAERQFLAELSHPNIVGIFNFVTHRGAGYIVEEFVGGTSLKQLLAQRRQANGGTADPMPVEQALAFILAILPAFAYLHSRALVYCDFKPDNVIQVADQVKLIDLGAVRRFDDPSPDVYGTVGYQAPEIVDLGPSIASDIYTIGRTLAVLTLDFRGYQKQLAHSLPDPNEHPALSRFESFYRLLVKATAPHPDDRFQSIAELSEQMLGVLREVVCLTTGTPHPSASTVFSSAGDDQSLPALAVDASDAAAAYLVSVSTLPGDRAAEEIQRALTAGTIAPSNEVRLRLASALLDGGNVPDATAQLDAIEADDPWEWRVSWLRGVLALQIGNPAEAVPFFDRCRTEVPGEIAPRLASAIAVEQAGDVVTAGALYEAVVAVDPSIVSAAYGLARCRAAAKNLAGALAAYDAVPATHRRRAEAELAAASLAARAGDLDEALRRLDTLRNVDERGRLVAEVDVYEHAVAAGLGNRRLRQQLETSLRRLARVTPERDERISLVDRANSERPFTIV